MPMDIGQRYLAGIRFVDGVTDLPAAGPMRVRTADVEFVANRSGVLAVRWARGFEAHAEPDYADPEVPLDPTEFEIEVWDPADRYLPRRFVLALPRRMGDEETPREVPLEVTMYPSPTARAGHNWSVVRGTVVDENGDPIPGAMVRLQRPAEGEDPPEVIARGLTAPLYHPSRPDHVRRSAGEFMIPVAGLPVTIWGDGNEVFGSELSVIVQIAVDTELSPTTLPDPDDIERLSAEGNPERIKTLSTDPIALAVGRQVVVPTITIDLSAN